jgi:hypothetical protein
MNTFETLFFSRYVPEWQELRGIVHEHFLVVLKTLTVWISFWALIPSFLYYQSEKLRDIIPFVFVEWFLILIYIKIIYEIFDWYNDVWIITNDSVIDLDWALFKTNVSSIHFENIEGIEVEQDGVIDTLFNKGTLVIHKMWDDTFAMEDAVIPFEALDEIEKFIAERESGWEKKDRLELILETLWGVVEEYLDRKGLREKIDSPETYREPELEIDEYTIDIRK